MELFVCLLFILPAGWFFLGIVLPLTRRAAEDACPGCTHPTQGLMRPVCPECGRDLTRGIQAADEMTGFWATWFAVNVLLGGFVLGIIALSCSFGIWVSRLAGSNPGPDGAMWTAETIFWFCFPLAFHIGSVLTFLWGIRFLRADRLKPFEPAGITETEPEPDFDVSESR